MRKRIRKFDHYAENRHSATIAEAIGRREILYPAGSPTYRHTAERHRAGQNRQALDRRAAAHAQGKPNTRNICRHRAAAAAGALRLSVGRRPHGDNRRRFGACGTLCRSATHRVGIQTDSARTR